jgi:hypothetical protein
VDENLKKGDGLTLRYNQGRVSGAAKPRRSFSVRLNLRHPAQH